MRQFCSVCKAHLEMTVVSDTSDDGVIWLKCPRCKGILPHMDDGTGDTGGQDDGDTATTAPEPAEEIDVSQAVPYEPTRSYEVGDVIHHRGWNDYGVVQAKDQLPGNRRVIKVRFTENGDVQLIEGTS